jgi:hypothetical protein
MENYMKQSKWTSILIVLLMSITSFSAMAHGGGHFRGYVGHSGYGLGFYSGFSSPFYFPYYEPYYDYPPAVALMPAPPKVYIQQNNVQTIQLPVPNYWYYCRNPEGYYPYVRECPAGCQPVAPQPSVR